MIFFIIIGMVLSFGALLVNFQIGIITIFCLVVLAALICGLKVLRNNVNSKTYTSRFWGFMSGLTIGGLIFIYYASYFLSKALTHSTAMGF